MRGIPLKAAVLLAVSSLILSLAPAAQAAGAVDTTGPELVSITRPTSDVISAADPAARLAVHATDPSGVQWLGVWVASDAIKEPFEYEYSSGIDPVTDARIGRPIWSYDQQNSRNEQPQRLTITRVELLDTLGNRTVVTDRAILDPLSYRAVNPSYDGDAPTLESIKVEPAVIRPGEEAVVSAVVRDATSVTGGETTLKQDEHSLLTLLDKVDNEVAANGDGTWTIRTVFRARPDTPYGSHPVGIFTYDEFFNLLNQDAVASISVQDPDHPVGTVRIDGKRQVSHTLSATAEGWDPAAGLSYSWKRWIPEISTAKTFELDGFYMWADLHLIVTGTWPDGTVRQRDAWSGEIAQGVLPVPPPQIDPTATVDRPLTLRQKDSNLTWKPNNRRIQWFRDGKQIDYASTPTYVPSPDDMGHRISVQTFHRKDGYADLTQESAAVLVGPGTLKAPNPTVPGTTWRVGQDLTAKPGTWSAGTQLHYQWQRNGKNITGARSETYTPVPDDRGAELRLRVTGTKPGYAQASRYSTTKTVAIGTITSPTPTASGTFRVGNRLTAQTPTWTRGSTLKYQWQREGRNIAGATGRTYNLGVPDRGKKVRVRITATKTGYTTVTRYSTARTIGYGVLKSSNPRFSGTPKVGSRVTVSPGTWTAGTKFTYQWTRNGRKISGATGRTYTIRSTDRRSAISVWVTGSKPGYASERIEAFLRIR